MRASMEAVILPYLYSVILNWFCKPSAEKDLPDAAATFQTESGKRLTDEGIRPGDRVTEENRETRVRRCIPQIGRAHV